MRIQAGKRTRRNTQKIVIGVVLAVVIAGGAGVVWLQTVRAKSATALPSAIATQLNFSPLVLSKAPNLRADSYKYDKTNGVLSYVVRDKTTNQHVTVTEQQQPAQFTEITGYQDQFLTNVIQQSETVQTSNGTVYLGHPSKQPNQQIAVIIDRGLLVFFTPQSSAQLDSNQWRTLVEQLQIQKIL